MMKNLRLYQEPPRRRSGSRGLLLIALLAGIGIGYIAGLWQQIAQKQQRIKNEKILAAGRRPETNTPSVRGDER